MSQYLQGTQKSIRAWSVHGLAVKAAFQLGLQSSEASAEFSPLEREVRKRTWYGCVVLDRLAQHRALATKPLADYHRTLSMTFGRPAAIPENYVKLDLPVDYDDILPSSTAGFDPVKRNSVLFFNATM